MKKSIALLNRFNSFTPQAVIKAVIIALICALLLAGVAYAAILNHKISGELSEFTSLGWTYQFSPD